MHQQLWGYKVEEKLYLGVREQKMLNTTRLEYRESKLQVPVSNGSCLQQGDSIACASVTRRFHCTLNK
jgi:hypothetical protein